MIQLIMDIATAKELVQLLKSKNVLFEDGLINEEIVQIEKKFNLRFPPDLKLFLQTALPVSGSFINWRLGLESKTEEEAIFSMINWPLEGMLFDMDHNNFWRKEWGSRPDNLEERKSTATYHYNTYPTLIPIYSHRFIPSEPCEEGNPVFSVYQTDIIYYGHDLPSYFANEFHFTLSGQFEILKSPRNIRFWSVMAVY